MLNKLISIISALFLVWLLISWIDVVANNTKPDTTNWKYNAIVMVLDWAEAHPPA